jgi:hypothetical protein
MAAASSVLVGVSLVRFATHGNSPFVTVPREVRAESVIVNPRRELALMG